MPNVLFIGCSEIQLPYLLSVKKLGYRVILTDGNDKSPGENLADCFYNIKYNNISALLEVAKTERLSVNDHVFTASSQFAYEGAAYVAQYCGMQYLSPDTVDIVLNKFKFYHLLSSLSVPVPPTTTYTDNQNSNINTKKTYYLKSDYGKSPNYCFRITKGEVPKLPINHDNYYRENFLIQEEVIGEHYRVNVYNSVFLVFRKFTDLVSKPVGIWANANKEIVDSLLTIIGYLQLDKMLVKFDIVINGKNWWLLDIGIDPPMRLRLLCNYIGIDFPMAYVRYYLTGDCIHLPDTKCINIPVLIKCITGNYCNVEADIS